MNFCLLAWAVDPSAALPGTDVTSAVRGLTATVVVLLLVGGLAWLLRRGTLVLPGRRRGQPLAVETAMPLGERRSLVIVTVEGRRLLLGLTPASVTLVTELAAQPPFASAVDRHAGGAQ
jgi:flagellar protein FliO/FliZ